MNVGNFIIVCSVYIYVYIRICIHVVKIYTYMHVCSKDIYVYAYKGAYNTIYEYENECYRCFELGMQTHFFFRSIVSTIKCMIWRNMYNCMCMNMIGTGAGSRGHQHAARSSDYYCAGIVHVIHYCNTHCNAHATHPATHTATYTATHTVACCLGLDYDCASIRMKGSCRTKE